MDLRIRRRPAIARAGAARHRGRDRGDRDAPRRAERKGTILTATRQITGAAPGVLRGPLALPGQTVGLLGGSFDPPHGGHVHVTRAALARFGLDRVWWLVSPGNPLKPRGPAPLAERMRAARALMRHPRVTVTDLEARLGTVHTAATLAALRARYPGVRFVWLMGADNLAQVHRWQDWRRIFDTVPVGVIGRPGTGAAPMARAARIYRESRLPGRAARLLPRAEAPAWCIAEGPRNPQSSTEIRARGGWG